MNPDTGHLKYLVDDDGVPEGYERVEGEIQKLEAKRLLKDKQETFIDDKSPILIKLADQLKSKNKKIRSKAKKKLRAKNRKRGVQK